MQKIKRILFSRVMVVSVAILLQILTFIIIIYRFSNYFVIDTIFTVLSVLVVLYILNGKTNPVYKIAWIIPILTFPVFGGLFYLMLGRNGFNKKMIVKMKEISYKMNDSLNQNSQTENSLFLENKIAANQAKYIERYSICPVYNNSTTEFLSPGDKFYKHLLKELQKAEKYIFLEFFIINEGTMWNSILEILKEKAKKGVDVRVIYDDVGCLFKLPFGYDKILESMGIKCCVFNPLKPIFSIRFNNRDHRKIAIIDGKTAYTGGVNLADEYINEIEKFGHWRDSAIAVKGEAVWSFAVMFLSMWNFLRNTDNDYSKFRPTDYGVNAKENGYVQPFNDSPLDGEPVSETVYLNLINQARRYIFIETPYLIADNKMMVALSIAAKRGVDVRIMTPHIPDKWYAFAVTQSNYAELLESGVSIYEYTPGFNHGKTFVVDDEYAVVGTINLDYRSLYLHFECGVWMYKTKSVLEVKEDTLRVFDICEKITFDSIRKIPWYKKIIGLIFKIFAPIM